MAYKKNRLRLKQERLSELRSKQGTYGNEVKARKRMAEATEMHVVGEIKTFGIFGEHHIEWLAGDSETHGYVKCDDKLSRPLTPRGFVSLLGRWLWDKQAKNQSKA